MEYVTLSSNRFIRLAVCLFGRLTRCSNASLLTVLTHSFSLLLTVLLYGCVILFVVKRCSYEFRVYTAFRFQFFSVETVFCVDIASKNSCFFDLFSFNRQNADSVL